MYVVVGLGNPGREYAFTRHNVGYMTLDILAERWNIEVRRHNFRAVFGEGFAGGKKVVLAKPETFMNNSGWSVRDLVNWYKCAPEELVLIYDDIDLPVGSLRIREGGSAGTHNGMRSVVYQLGFDDFPRIRVGIGAAEGERGLIAHVMSMPAGEELEKLQSGMRNAADAAELIVSGQLQEAQGRFNKKAKSLKKAGQAAEKTEGPDKAENGMEP